MSTHEINVDSLYRKEAKVQPRSVTGLFARLRVLSVFVLLGLFYLLPWIQWGKNQIILFDLPARKFHVFGLTFWPQDFIFLAMLLIIAGLSLFFFTALAGRLWCGFACPQTVWTEVFMLVEKWVEGDRLQRLKLDRSPWTTNKIFKKGLKQFLWIVLALWTGFTFVGFFSPIRELAVELITLSISGWALFWILFYGFATYGNAGILREQVCKYMCPYARFQGAMFDEDTLVITYDKNRGEPRGSRKRKSDPKEQGLGSCIDCTLCVQVCPTGIDIREGLQYECIACAACIDVCDDVMEKMDYPKGLIRYTTDNKMAGKSSKILRPRILIYGTLLSLLIIGLSYSIATRELVLAKFIHDRNGLFTKLNDGSIENAYSLRLVNKTDLPHQFKVIDLSPNYLKIDNDIFQLGPGENNLFPVRLHKNPSTGIEKVVEKVTLSIQAVDDPKIITTLEAKFLSPRK
ncbi:MAG: cytochrome c oxidase accessory protein FixG [Cocleimonas sp.]|jgi:cytochrome c oxidase accessory protein FixG